MPERRCATEGCTGTLPDGKGKHCPRCGGTTFLNPRKRPSWIRLVALTLALAIAIGIFTARSIHQPMSTGTSASRAELTQSYEVASRMTSANARDDAYADIVHR